MSTLTQDDIPQAMADAIASYGPDLDEATCVFLLARKPEYLMREIREHAAEAVAIADMQRWCARESERLKADIEAEMRR